MTYFCQNILLLDFVSAPHERPPIQPSQNRHCRYCGYNKKSATPQAPRASGGCTVANPRAVLGARPWQSAGHVDRMRGAGSHRTPQPLDFRFLLVPKVWLCFLPLDCIYLNNTVIVTDTHRFLTFVCGLAPIVAMSYYETNFCMHCTQCTVVWILMCVIGSTSALGEFGLHS